MTVLQIILVVLTFVALIVVAPFISMYALRVMSLLRLARYFPSYRDGALPGSDPKNDPNRRDDGTHDIFISYRTLDADFVRTFAERLMGAGLAVWFAEYKILLFNREEFEVEIDRGLASSDLAIYFVNRSFFTSEHCRRELDFVIKNPNAFAKGVYLVVEGTVPELDRLSLSDNVQRIGCDSFRDALSDLASVLNGAFADLALPSRWPPCKQERLRKLPVAQGQLTIGLGSWQTAGPNPMTQSTDDEHSFQKQQDGIHAHIGIASGESMFDLEMRYDDGEEVIFGTLLNFGRLHFLTLNRPCYGIHQYRQNETKFIGFTYRQSAMAWGRKYIFTFPIEGSLGPLEVVVDVFVQTDFAGMCQLLPYIDGLVLGLEFQPSLAASAFIEKLK